MLSSLIFLTDARKNTPPAERLGYIPSFEVAFFSSLEYRFLISELLFYDAVFYYGTVMDKPGERPEYSRIFKYADTSTRLNPYNIDSYYFSQAILTWDAGMVNQMNSILQRGVLKRKWDFFPPYFLGFNCAYFLNDYENAAKYLSLAAKLNPKADFLPSLVGRLYYQANKTEFAIEYLKTIYRGAKNSSVNKSLQIRIDALERIAFLENAVKIHLARLGRLPADINDLVKSGIIKSIPEDPYGGRFYIDKQEGRVKTTSNLAIPRR
jgi:tetratricopeptide (TPR) repeat protein